MNLLVKGHRNDARQAQPYHQLSVWRRMLNKSRQIKKTFEKIWETRKAKGIPKGKGNGPIAILERTVEHLGWKWEKEPWTFQRTGKIDLPFLDQEDGWWKHEVRDEIRDMIWRTEKATTNRESFQGVEQGVDYEATTKLYRMKVTKRTKKKSESEGNHSKEEKEEQGKDEDQASNEENNLFEAEEVEELQRNNFQMAEEQRSILRTVLTGSIKSGKKLKEAGIRISARCQHCGENIEEDAEHIGWNCKRWRKIRAKWIGKYSQEELDNLPTCTKICGIKIKNPTIFEEQIKISSEEPTDPMPPCRYEGSTEGELIENGKLIVASDGACPNQLVTATIEDLAKACSKQKQCIQ